MLPCWIKHILREEAGYQIDHLQGIWHSKLHRTKFKIQPRPVQFCRKCNPEYIMTHRSQGKQMKFMFYRVPHAVIFPILLTSAWNTQKSGFSKQIHNKNGVMTQQVIPCVFHLAKDYRGSEYGIRYVWFTCYKPPTFSPSQGISRIQHSLLPS